MPEPSLTIRTGARLHFGPLSFKPAGGRHFGGIGLMVQAPGVSIAARLLSEPGEDVSSSPRAAEFVSRFRERSRLPRRPVRIDVTEEIPSHQGLGSGTQLGLAVAEAMSRLLGEKLLSAADLARLTARGDRSAVGLFGYEQGGFLVDAGHRRSAGSAAGQKSLGELACRIPFPEEWPILLVAPGESAGLHGEQEREILEHLPAMPPGLEGELARLTLTEILPALNNRNFPDFSQALLAYGERIGRFFSRSQQGLFANARMRELARELNRQGIRGIVQSSWGPTIAVFCKNPDQAAEVRERVEADPAGAGCRLIVTHARNTGRSVTPAGAESC